MATYQGDRLDLKDGLGSGRQPTFILTPRYSFDTLALTRGSLTLFTR